MAKDYSFRYSVHMTTVSGYNTPAGWPTRNRVGDRRPSILLGTPTNFKLARYVEDYNASILPGGVNAHVGANGRCTHAVIIDSYDKSVVASWRAE